MRISDHPFAEQLRAERRANKAAADIFVQVCQTGHFEALTQAAHLLNETNVDGWVVARGPS